MDETQALRILSALASGADPSTGEVLAKDSPYQAPDIIRALYVAIRALEVRAGAPNPRPSQSASTRNSGYDNAGKSWGAEEDRQLLAAFDSGKSLEDLAQLHRRTQGGVRARLEKHGRLEPSPATRWPAKSPSNRAEVRDVGS